jgi:RimJ/RimL family protein N-acetyltransferase
MQPKLLTIKNYFDRFNFQENGTGCGFETEPESGENYLWVQTFLPKDFFNLDHPSLIFNPFLRHQIEDIPDQVQVKFELFGIGSLDDVEAFIFKPWVVNVDNPMLFQLLEGFHLFVPSTLFYNLIERLIFLEQIDPNIFRHIRILQDIPSNTFQRFGLDRHKVPKVFKSDKLEISRLDEVDKSEISKFYADNWEGITPQLENKYFRPLLNTWFRITSEELNSQLFGLKQSTVRKTVGFLRLYNTNSSFTGGTSLEYIIDKAYRKKGYATQSSLALIDYLKNYSYAISLGAEVNDNNEFSKKVLKRLGFNESISGPFQSDNFGLSLFDNLKFLEENFDTGDIEVSVLNKYASKYSRYF